MAKPEPLDYRNPKSPPEILQTQPSEQPEIVPAIPVEFDTPLSSSEDHAAAMAIENQCKREKIPTYRVEDHRPAHRAVQLFVRAADHPRAAKIAETIFARRQKIKSFPRQKPLPDQPNELGGTIF